MTTPAHSTQEHLALLQVYPEHIERAQDPHYHLFTAARNRLKKAGLLKCWIDNDDCDSTHPIELHHNDIEFALSNLVDLDRFNLFHAAMHDMVHVAGDDEFQAYVESEGNLLPLCKLHHTGVLGIHVIHFPAWKIQAYIKAGVPRPERKIQGSPVSVRA